MPEQQIEQDHVCEPYQEYVKYRVGSHTLALAEWSKAGPLRKSDVMGVSWPAVGLVDSAWAALFAKAALLASIQVDSWEAEAKGEPAAEQERG